MITTIRTYQCNVCKRIYDYEEDALECENKPEQSPSFSIGDTVFIRIRGINEYVKDTITDIKKSGHDIYYITTAKYGWHKRGYNSSGKWTEDYICESNIKAGYVYDDDYPMMQKHYPTQQDAKVSEVEEGGSYDVC